MPDADKSGGHEAIRHRDGLAHPIPGTTGVHPQSNMRYECDRALP